MNNNCEVCKKKIIEPLYWADPKFYNIPKNLVDLGYGLLTVDVVLEVGLVSVSYTHLTLPTTPYV